MIHVLGAHVGRSHVLGVHVLRNGGSMVRVLRSNVSMSRVLMTHEVGVNIVAVVVLRRIVVRVSRIHLDLQWADILDSWAQEVC